MNWEQLNIIIYIALNVFDLAIILRYDRKIFGKCKLEKQMLIPLMFFFSSFFSCFIKPEIPYMNLVNISCWSILFLIFFHGSVKIKGFAALVLLAFAGASQAVPYFLTNRYGDHFRLQIILSGHLLFFCMLELGSRLYRTHSDQMKGHMWLVLLFIPVCSLISFPCMMLLVLDTNLPLNMLYACLIPLFIFLLFINFTAFYLFDKLSELIETTERNVRLEEQLQYQTAYYVSVEEGQKCMKGLKHDMKNHLETVDSLLTQNKIKDAQQYVQRLTESIKKVDHVIVTNIPPIDTILNLKLEAAKRNGITFDYQINIPGGLPISYEKATAILGNILDNAIEAQDFIEHDKRKIEFFMTYSNDSLMISVRNPVNMEHIDLKSLKTSKREKSLHGIGLLNVQKAVDEMGGILKLNAHKSFFQADVLLYF